MADFSMSDMPWLGQPADPAGSLLRGVQAGSAISSARTQRGALAQRKMEFDQEQSMREREWRERMAVLPLEMTLKQQEGQMNALKIEDVLKRRQQAIDNEKTIQTAWDWAGKEVSKGNLKGAFDVAFGMAGQSIGIIEDPKFIALTNHLTKLVDLANQRAEIDSRMPAANLGGVTVVTNPLDQTQKAALVRTGPNSLTAFPKVEDPNAFQSDFGKLVEDRNRAFKLGKAEDITRFDAMIAKRVAESGMSLSTNPDGTVNITQGKPGSVPTAMVTKSEESIAGAVNAAKLGSTLLNKLRPEDVGILGRGGELIVDQNLAQLVPGAANLQRINSRSLLRLFRNDFTRALKFDSQLSNEERQRIEAMLPGEGTNESLPSALEKIRTATKEVAERARFNAQRANRPLPNELLKPAELIERVKKGEITWQQATDIAKTSPFRDEFDNFVETK